MTELKEDRKVLSSLWLAEEKKERKKKSWLAIRKRIVRKKNNCPPEFRFLG